MKNPQRIAQRKTAAARQAEYAELEPDKNGHKPKFVKWLRGKFGWTVAERQGEKPAEVKVGAPYQRVQHRPPARIASGRRP